MQFIKYLNERAELIYDIDEFNDILHNKCKPYLKMIKNWDKPLLRGMDVNIPGMGIKDVRKNRKPRGTRDDIFINLNDGLDDNRHNRRDKSFMVSSGDVSVFGNSYYIFPIGNFSYTGMDASDMNMNDNRTGGTYKSLYSYDFENDDFEDTELGDIYSIKLKKPFGDYFHTDKGISTAVKNEYEIGINCRKYLFVKSEMQYGGHKKSQMVIEFD